MPRVKVFDEDKALQAAMLEFWRSGYEATSIQDLEQAMALKRTSIYNAFGNKRSLFQQALQRYLQNVLARFLAVLEEAQTIREAINGVLNEVINLHFNKSHPGGCMVVLSILESHQHDHITKKALDTALRKLKKGIVLRLERGVAESELPPDYPCGVVGGQITALITGMIVMAKGNTSKMELKKIIDSSVSLLFDK